jgi:hypothetical protein
LHRYLLAVLRALRLEAHEYAFHYFGELFGLIRYDRLESAVKQILRGHRREDTTRFIGSSRTGAFSEFCSPEEPGTSGREARPVGHFTALHDHVDVQFSRGGTWCGTPR